MTKMDINFYSMKNVPCQYITITSLWNYATILKSGMKEFWSDEIPMSGAAIYQLSEYGFVEKTGETKDVLIHTYENNYKKYTAYKWRLSDLTISTYERLFDDINSLAALVNFYEDVELPLM